MRGAVLLTLAVLLVSAGSAHAADMSGVVDTLLGKYQSAGQAWVGALKGGATTLFWILATISLSWTCISMALKRAERAAPSCDAHEDSLAVTTR